MRRLNKDLSKDITNYGRIAKSTSNIEERIKELDNVLQEATKKKHCKYLTTVAEYANVKTTAK